MQPVFQDFNWDQASLAYQYDGVQVVCSEELWSCPSTSHPCIMYLCKSQWWILSSENRYWQSDIDNRIRLGCHDWVQYHTSIRQLLSPWHCIKICPHSDIIRGSDCLSSHIWVYMLFPTFFYIQETAELLANGPVSCLYPDCVVILRSYGLADWWNSPIYNKIGRKNTIVISAFVKFLDIRLMAGAQSFGMFLAARLILGFRSGISGIATPT